MVIKLKDCFNRTITTHQPLLNAIIAVYHTLIVKVSEGDSIISKNEINLRKQNFRWDIRNPWLYQNLNEMFKIPPQFFDSKLNKHYFIQLSKSEFPLFNMGTSFILDLTKEIKGNNLQLLSVIDYVDILVKRIGKIMLSKGIQNQLIINDLKISVISMIEPIKKLHFHIILQKDESLEIGFCLFALYLNGEYSADGYIGFKFTS